MIHCTNCAAPCKNPYRFSYRYNDKHRKYTSGKWLVHTGYAFLCPP